MNSIMKTRDQAVAPAARPPGREPRQRATTGTAAPGTRQGDTTRQRHRRDDGISFVEILVSIVLLGMVVTAILATLNTSIASSSLNRNHANAHAWLQSASDLLYGSAREDCGTELATAAQRTLDEERVRDRYSQIVRTTSNPEGWVDDRISVLEPVLFWDGDSTYQTTCYDDGGVNLQLITIEVRDPEGRIVESVQVVKG